MYKTTTLLNEWIQENNDIVEKWKQAQKNANAPGNAKGMPNTRGCSLEFNKLLLKIQGAPDLADFTELELAVLYNASVLSIALSEFSKVELLITNAIVKILQIQHYNPESTDHLILWRKVSEKAQTLSPSFHLYVGQLLCLQWTIWLATQKYHVIWELEKRSSLFDVVSTHCERIGEPSGSLSLVLEPKDLVELLHVCTLIEHGAQSLRNGQHSEALSDMSKANSLAAPKALLACTHLIRGSCFAQMKRPQMALVCFREALEADGGCVGALYQSALIYRQLGNKEAEIKALEILHSGLNSPHTSELDEGSGSVVSCSLLLASESLKDLLTVPSRLTLHRCLASRCVLYGRVYEGVEHYLDLIASLQTDQQNLCVSAEVPAIPCLTDLYLEAAAAMLTLQRPADCIALCDEVVAVTLDLLPERLTLGESDLEPETEPGEPHVNPDKGAMMFSVGAGHLLQGHCYMTLKDWKQAITNYTRCINLLLKIQFKNKVSLPLSPSTRVVHDEGSKLTMFQKLKAFSFAGRGICFAQTDQLTAALRDLQLSLQMFPECGFALRWCGEVLWTLKRREEAAICWKKMRNIPTDSSKFFCAHLLEPLTDHLLNPSMFQQRMKELGFEEDENKACL